MADDAVRCEPVSTSNSLIIRENTGNYSILTPQMEPTRSKRLVSMEGKLRKPVLRSERNANHTEPTLGLVGHGSAMN